MYWCNKNNTSQSNFYTINILQTTDLYQYNLKFRSVKTDLGINGCIHNLVTLHSNVISCMCTGESAGMVLKDCLLVCSGIITMASHFVSMHDAWRVMLIFICITMHCFVVGVKCADTRALIMNPNMFELVKHQPCTKITHV